MVTQRSSSPQPYNRPWYTRLRQRKPLAALIISTMLLLTPMLVLFNVSAASGFASPLFQTQWQQGEAVVPNFWGPVALAKDGQQESYVEAPGGQRLVQYFDKARMELTNPATNTVTNGLLATELITGNRQLGDNTFANIGPANIPVAGDPSNIGPTYAMIQANAAQLRVPVTSTPGSPVTLAMTASGSISNFPNGSSFPQANIGGYDGTTQHNVPAAFQNFRNTAGVLTIGLAISEPFWSNVKVAGSDTQVLIQAFERRVLTYTPSNPAQFQVEMGNIGQHYYTWRYVTNPDSGGAATGTSTSTATGTATTVPTTTPTATTPTASPAPTLSSVTISNITTTGAHVTYTTDVPACGTVEYRVAGTAAFTTDISTITCATPSMSFAKDLTGLSPTTNYEVRGAAYTTPGSIGYSPVAPLTTLTPDTTAPVISGIAWSAVDKNNIKLAFALNEAGTAKVVFGTAADLSGATTVDATPGAGNNFSATFGVTREKQYYYKVTATDASSNNAETLVKQVMLNRTFNIKLTSLTVKLNHFAPAIPPFFTACTPSYTYVETIKYTSGTPATKTHNFNEAYAASVPKEYIVDHIETFAEDPARSITITLDGATIPDAGANPACFAAFTASSVNLVPGSDWSVGSSVNVESADFKAFFAITDSLSVAAP